MLLSLPPFLIDIFLVAIGLALGSFATAVAHRLPLKKSVGVKDWSARSMCPRCKHVLKPLDLVPVVSWVINGGKCRYCRKSISIAYPLTELGVVLACLAAYWAKGLSPDLFFIIAAIPFLAALLLIDLRHMILPNNLLLILAGLGLGRMIYHIVDLHEMPEPAQIIEYFSNIIIFAGISWILGFVMEKILKKEALGMGDVKFFAMAGLWLGLSQLGWFCALSGIFGLLFASIFRNYARGGHFPFGPALITALFLLILTDSSLFQ